MTKVLETTTIVIEEGSAGLIYASSPDIPGLLVAKRTVEEAWADIPRALAELRALKPPTAERSPSPAA